MNKSELIDAIASRTDSTKKDTGEFIEALLDTVMTQVANKERITLVGFGTFEARNRQAKIGRNPQNGEPLQVAAKTVPFFKPGKEFSDSVK